MLEFWHKLYCSGIFQLLQGNHLQEQRKGFFPSILENPVDLLFEKFLLNISLKSS